jgi:DNA polymerase/3'-5' exonuclease PolX
MDIEQKWAKELDLLAQVRLSVFELMIEDRVKNYKYSSVYHHLSKATEALEEIIFSELKIPTPKIKQKLETQIAKALESRSEIGLSELVKLYPIDCGLEELTEYLEIANQPPHSIDVELKDAIEVTNASTDSQMTATVPRIIYRK